VKNLGENGWFVDFLENLVSLRKGAYAAASGAAWQEIRGYALSKNISKEEYQHRDLSASVIPTGAQRSGGTCCGSFSKVDL
jgi:hypothetical protein